jgi:excinuclease ABC subunit C
MKMCLAPCFKGCTDDQYSAEVTRLETFFDSRGLSLMREISAARDKASADLEFETASALHAQLEKLKPVVSQLPEIVRRLDRLNALMIQPSSQPNSVTFFRIHGGCLSDPITFELPGVPGPHSDTAPHSQVDSRQATIGNDSAVRGKKTPHSMESRVLEALGQPGAAAVTCSRQETMEHLAILKRWYYRSSKLGEIFFAEENGELPMRRIVRGISRVFRGEKPAADLSETARDYWINRGREAELGKD